MKKVMRFADTHFVLVVTWNVIPASSWCLLFHQVKGIAQLSAIWILTVGRYQSGSAGIDHRLDITLSHDLNTAQDSPINYLNKRRIEVTKIFWKIHRS